MLLLYHAVLPVLLSLSAVYVPIKGRPHLGLKQNAEEKRLTEPEGDRRTETSPLDSFERFSKLLPGYYEVPRRSKRDLYNISPSQRLHSEKPFTYTNMSPVRKSTTLDPKKLPELRIPGSFKSIIKRLEKLLRRRKNKTPIWRSLRTNRRNRMPSPSLVVTVTPQTLRNSDVTPTTQSASTVEVNDVYYEGEEEKQKRNITKLIRSRIRQMLKENGN